MYKDLGVKTLEFEKICLKVWAKKGEGVEGWSYLMLPLVNWLLKTTRHRKDYLVFIDNHNDFFILFFIFFYEVLH